MFSRSKHRSREPPASGIAAWSAVCFRPQKSGKPGFCCKICRCITFPVGLSTHGSLAVAAQGNGTPLAGSHRINYNTVRQPFMNNQTNREKRCSAISFRVSDSQRERIDKLAKQCGMNRSEYLLSRVCGYEPKARLTYAQTKVRDELIIARSDYAKYTSMLNAMPQGERRAMFRNQPWMIEALRLLNTTAELITDIINRHFTPNRVPGTALETDKEQESK